MLESAEVTSPMTLGNNVAVAVAAEARAPKAEINSISYEYVTTRYKAL